MKWYIVHVYSGFEQKVVQSIKEQAAKKGLADKIGEILVPKEEIQEMRKGKKVTAEHKIFPGYILINMELDDATQNLVQNTSKVTGFLGSSRPQPVPEREVERIFSQMEEGAKGPKNTISFEVGDSVKIIDGPFNSFVGNVSAVNEKAEKLTVQVSVFGRSTPMEMDFSQVEKN